MQEKLRQALEDETKHRNVLQENRALVDENACLRKDLEAATEQCRALAEAAVTTQQLQNCESEIDRLKLQLSSLSEENQSLRDSRSRSEQSVSELQSLVNTLQTQLEVSLALLPLKMSS